MNINLRKKDTSKTRYKLINPYACSSIDDKLLEDTMNYIYNNYDVNYIKEINFMGDCAKWIKNFPNSHWFNFTSDTKVQFSMDNFYFKQVLIQLTTKKNDDVYDELLEYVNSNNKKRF